MKIAGFVVSAFSNRFRQGKASIREVFGEMGIAILGEIKTASEDFLLDLERKSLGYDAVAIGFDDSEFYSLGENQKLVDHFVRYQGDIGFGDNHPSGVVFEIVNRQVLPIMDNLRKQHKISITRNLIQDIIHIDVNLFDLENLYAEVNLRTLRLDFFSYNIQNQFLINRVKAFLPPSCDPITSSFKSISESILSNRKKLKTIPKFFEISLTNKTIQPYLYGAPVKKSPAFFLSLNDYVAMLEKIINFSPDPMISFNGVGEMTANPDWQTIVKHTLAKRVSCILETTGVLWSNALSDAMAHWQGHEKLTVIFTVDTLNSKLYEALRGKDYPLAPILEKIEYYLLRYGKNAYVQTTKTNETFPYLNDFYQYFNKITKNIIIYKYNSYQGRLPERRINPMEPFEKIDCWHLKRDLKIDELGDVWVCKQDVEKTNLLGNLKKDSLKDLFKAGEVYLEKHLQGWDFCKNCDEYYNYNF